MGLIFKRPFTRQPQGVVALDRSNPLTEAPGFVWVPQRNREVVNQIPWAKAGSTPPVIKATPAGIATLHTTGLSSVSYVDLGTPTQASTVDIAAGPSTFVGVFYANSTTGVAIATRNDGNSTTGWDFGYHGTSGVAAAALGFSKTYSSTNIYRGITDSVSTTGLNVLVCVFDGAAGINGTCQFYLNGKAGTPAAGQSGSGTTGSDATLQLRVGNTGYITDHSHDGSLLLAGAFRRMWSPAEAFAFMANPWQIFVPSSRRLLVDVPASGTAVNPGVGAVAFTGYAPTIAQPQSANPGAGALTLTGYAPTIAQPKAVLPGVGSLAITGYAPAVVLNANVNPGAGSMVLTGYAPSISQPQTAAPGVGVVTITGYAPSISQGQSANPGVGAITITGYAPSIAQPQTAGPGVGTIAITGYAPAIAQPQAVAPGAGAITFTGYSPSVAQSANQSVLPGAGTISLSGFAPTIVQSANQAVLPGAGSVTLTGFAPTVAQAAGSPSLVPDTGVLSITGFAPSVSQASAGGIDTWGSVYVRTKKKKKEPEAIPVAGPVVREFLEAAMQAHEPPSTKVAGRRVPAVIDDEDEEELWMLLL